MYEGLAHGHLYECQAPVRRAGTCTCTKGWHLYGHLAPDLLRHPIQIDVFDALAPEHRMYEGLAPEHRHPNMYEGLAPGHVRRPGTRTSGEVQGAGSVKERAGTRASP